MAIVTTSAKGQVVIPAAIRRKIGLSPGQKVDVMVQGGDVVIRPLPRDPVEALHGKYKQGDSLTEALMRERGLERRREERKSP